MRLQRHISSLFLRCALLTPNMHGMVSRDGVLGATSKGSRMKYHGTAPACSIAPYKVSRLFCPQCQDLIIAATQSQHVSRNEIRHWWVCEACGHEFRTTVRWLPSPVEGESAADEAELLPSQREPFPAWNIQRGLQMR
jgi:DNA-directed RNA polymerase subunit M/transcription elongation factor TFIIS